jgi:hypothetical protein
MALLSFNWENQQNALAALTDQLNHVLGRHGFTRKEKREWERNRRWIVDGVYLSVKPAPSWLVDPHVITYLPYRPPGSEESCLIFDSRNVERVLGASDVHLKLPKHSLGISRFVRKALKRIEQSLTWFDQFASPAECLALADRIYKPGCPAHKNAVEYLTSLTHESV